MELSHYNPTLYQGRHSGASLAIAEQRTDSAGLQRRGRWRTSKSLARYEKHALLQGVLASLLVGRLLYAQRCGKEL